MKCQNGKRQKYEQSRERDSIADGNENSDRISGETFFPTYALNTFPKYKDVKI